MSSTRKFLALALASYQNKQYEEAGVFFAQAAQAEDADAVAEELGQHGEDSAAAVAEASGNSPAADQDGELSSGVDDEQRAGTPPENLESLKDPNESESDDDLEWGDNDMPSDDRDEESVSSTTRRKTTSLFHIGKILAASMELGDEQQSESESDADEEGDDLVEDSDPDFDGEVLIPASFSSVSVRKV